MMDGSEKAAKPTTNPTTPYIKASLAFSNLLGSPWAVTNKNPATKNIIKATAKKTVQIRVKIPLTIGVSKLYKGGSGTIIPIAKALIGKTNKTDKKTSLIKTFFIKRKSLRLSKNT